MRGMSGLELSKQRPYVYVTMEVYDTENGIKGAGGLGILAADTRRIAEQIGIPLVTITPFYRREFHQMVSGETQKETIIFRRPETYGFRKYFAVKVKKNKRHSVDLDIYLKKFRNTFFLTISEQAFGELYAGDSHGEHRLYQQVALGFGGFAAIREFGIAPACMQLNEAAAAFAAVAWLDSLVGDGLTLDAALKFVRSRALYTNHTLVQAAESEFSLRQFECGVFPNIHNHAVRQFIESMFKDGKIKLSAITIELSGKHNCVSKLHAAVADYHDASGNKVNFTAVTNGIDMDKWTLSETIRLYRDKKIIDKNCALLDDWEKKIDDISNTEIQKLYEAGRARMNEILAKRKDQYGKAVYLPKDSFVFGFKRRLVDYKRPWLPFEHLAEFRKILVEADAHYIISGRVHLGDHTMMQKIKKILQDVDGDTELKKRVHYIENYDETVAYALSIGSNASINVPVVGQEACGTSWEKDIANLTMLISTDDGGIADIKNASYLKVTGTNQDQELESLYKNMREAIQIWRDENRRSEFLRQQLKEYLPIISGPRMMNEYLDLLQK